MKGASPSVARRAGALLVVSVAVVGAALAVVACEDASLPEVAFADAATEPAGEPDASEGRPQAIDGGTGREGGACTALKGACDIVLQDCPDQDGVKQECVVRSSGGSFVTRCVRVQPSQRLPMGWGCCPAADNPCLPGLTCVGAPCVDGGPATARCTLACCEGDHASCGQSHPEGIGGQCDVTLFAGTTPLYGVCSYRERCKPFGIEPCRPGQTCLIEDEMGTAGCIVSGGAKNREPCRFANDCADGLVCDGTGEERSFRMYCLKPGSDPFFDATAGTRFARANSRRTARRARIPSSMRRLARESPGAAAAHRTRRVRARASRACPTGSGSARYPAAAEHRSTSFRSELSIRDRASREAISMRAIGAAWSRRSPSDHDHKRSDRAVPTAGWLELCVLFGDRVRLASRSKRRCGAVSLRQRGTDFADARTRGRDRRSGRRDRHRIRKLFALASVTALGGFVATTGVTGCSSTDKVTPSGDAGPGGGAHVKKTDAQKPPPADDGGRDDSPTCKADIQFTPDATKPPAPRQESACTAAAIDALADACIADATSKECKDARAEAANKTCAECIFGAKADEEWKAIVLAPGEKPSAIYNQEGCVDYLTGVKGCGHKYVT
jgi:hypothetical protein